MEIVGLEPRRSDLARGILIARSTRPLDAGEQKALWEALAAAGVTEQADEDTDDEPARSGTPRHGCRPLPQKSIRSALALEATAERVRHRSGVVRQGRDRRSTASPGSR